MVQILCKGVVQFFIFTEMGDTMCKNREENKKEPLYMQIFGKIDSSFIDKCRYGSEFYCSCTHIQSHFG